MLRCHPLKELLQEENRMLRLTQDLRRMRKHLFEALLRARRGAPVSQDPFEADEKNSRKAVAARMIQKRFRQRLLHKMAGELEVAKFRHDSVRTRLKEATGRHCLLYYFNPENSLDPHRQRGWQWITKAEEYEDYVKFLTRKAAEDAVTAKQALPLQVMDKLELEEEGKGLQVPSSASPYRSPLSFVL